MKGLQGCFSLIHPSLRKLPGPFDLEPLTDQKLVIAVQEEKRHVRAVGWHT